MHVVTIGGSDAGISAALRARELDPDSEVTVVVADAYPNFSICGIPYYLSGEVTDWRNLAHRTIKDLEATGMRLRLDTTAPPARQPLGSRPDRRPGLGPGHPPAPTASDLKLRPAYRCPHSGPGFPRRDLRH